MKNSVTLTKEQLSVVNFYLNYKAEGINLISDSYTDGIRTIQWDADIMFIQFFAGSFLEFDGSVNSKTDLPVYGVTYNRLVFLEIRSVSDKKILVEMNIVDPLSVADFKMNGKYISKYFGILLNDVYYAKHIGSGHDSEYEFLSDNYIDIHNETPLVRSAVEEWQEDYVYWGIGVDEPQTILSEGSLVIMVDENNQPLQWECMGHVMAMELEDIGGAVKTVPFSWESIINE